MSDDGLPEVTPSSLGVRLSSAFTTLIARVQECHLMESDLYWNDRPYRDLAYAMDRLRGCRWDDYDDERLSELEARAFRLLAAMRRLQLELSYAEIYPDAWAKWAATETRPLLIKP